MFHIRDYYIYSRLLYILDVSDKSVSRKPGTGQSSNAKGRKFMGQKKDIYEPETPGGIRRTQERKLEGKKQIVMYIYKEGGKKKVFSDLFEEKMCTFAGRTI